VLPGDDLVRSGLEDLDSGVESPAALLVAMAAPRLRRLGVPAPPGPAGDPSHRLYEILAEEDRATAHSRYNALVGQVVSYARALERARAG